MIAKLLNRMFGTSITLILLNEVENCKDSFLDSPKIYDLNDLKLKSFHFRNEKAEMGEWIRNGSQCYYIERENEVSGYGWMHFSNNRKVGGVTINFNPRKSAWLGPDYVFPRFRGNRLQQRLIKTRANVLADKNLKYCITAVNARNTASLKGFNAVGFVPVYEVTSRRIFFLSFSQVRCLNKTNIKDAGLYVDN